MQNLLLYNALLIFFILSTDIIINLIIQMNVVLLVNVFNSNSVSRLQLVCDSCGLQSAVLIQMNRMMNTLDYSACIVATSCRTSSQDKCSFFPFFSDNLR